MTVLMKFAGTCYLFVVRVAKFAIRGNEDKVAGEETHGKFMRNGCLIQLRIT